MGGSTLENFPIEAWHRLNLNRSLIDYKEVKRLLEERIEEKVVARWKEMCEFAMFTCAAQDKEAAAEQAYHLNAEKADRRFEEERIERRRQAPIVGRWALLYRIQMSRCAINDRVAALAEADELKAEKAKRVRNGGA